VLIRDSVARIGFLFSISRSSVSFVVVNIMNYFPITEIIEKFCGILIFTFFVISEYCTSARLIIKYRKE